MGEWLDIVRFEPLTYFFRGVTLLGNDYFFYMFLPIIYWCWRKRTGAHLIVLVILSAYLNFLLKDLFAWERPPTSLWLISAQGYAFPSSHAALAVVTWGYLACEVRRKWFTALAISLIVLISLSRVYLGVHYPQDVIAGVAVGTLFLYLYRLAVKWLGPQTIKINDLVKGVMIIVVSIVMLLGHTNTLIATATGMLAGTVVGFLMEPHFADFEASGGWIQNILKAVVGIVILLAIWQGLEWTFPDNASFKWFQFFAMGTWMTAGAPWLFVQLRLARREA